MTPEEIFKAAHAKLLEAKAIADKAEAEKRSITEEEDTQIQSLLAEQKRLDTDARRRREIESTLAAYDEPLPARGSPIDPEKAASGLPRIPAEPRDHKVEAMGGFENFGDFAMSVFNSGPGRSRDQRLLIRSGVSGMSVTVDADGGYLVPPAFSTAIWDKFNAEPDNLLALTDQIPVPVGTESMTMLANAETSRATGSRYGGIRGYWIAEAEQMTKSKPTFRKIEGRPHALGVFTYVTDKLLRNATTLESYLTTAAAREINWLVSNAIINGSGAGQPLGILNSASLVTVAKETGQLAKTVVTENIVNMWARLHPASRSNAKWFINVDVEPQLYQMVIGVGTAGMPTFMPPGGISSSPYATLMGRPIVPVEYCQTLGTKGDIYIADLSAYASFVQGGIESAMSIHLRFDYNESCFRFLFYVDGQPWVNSAVTPANGTNTLSPFVTLAVRA